VLVPEGHSVSRLATRARLNPAGVVSGAVLGASAELCRHHATGDARVGSAPQACRLPSDPSAPGCNVFAGLLLERATNGMDGPVHWRAWVYGMALALGAISGCQSFPPALIGVTVVPSNAEREPHGEAMWLIRRRLNCGSARCVLLSFAQHAKYSACPSPRPCGSDRAEQALAKPVARKPAQRLVSRQAEKGHLVAPLSGTALALRTRRERGH
jgi:hypothetical protein